MSERTVVKKKKKWGKIYEYSPKVRASVLSDDQIKEISKELKKTKGMTPQALAIKFDIKVSMAKKILRQMAEKGDLTIDYLSAKYQVFSN